MCCSYHFAYDRKPRKAIDTSNLETREEHIYPDVENRDDYVEIPPEVTETLVYAPARMSLTMVLQNLRS